MAAWISVRVSLISDVRSVIGHCLARAVILGIEDTLLPFVLVVAAAYRRLDMQRMTPPSTSQTAIHTLKTTASLELVNDVIVASLHQPRAVELCGLNCCS